MKSETIGNWIKSVTYKPVSTLIQTITDENSFKTSFVYDGLQRLKEANAFFANGDPKSTTTYTYNYFNPLNPLSATNCNAVATSTAFVGIATPLSSKQVLDGLGRPISGVKENYDGSNRHVANYVSYDPLGRQNRVYQPFVTNVYGYINEPTTTPFTYTKYEASPLSRPIEQIAEDNKSVLMAYGTNVGDEVLKFNVVTTPTTYINTITVNGSYSGNLLYKTTVTNENGKQTHIFKDKLDRVVLTRKKLGNDNVDTYNVYDDWGNLVMVIPPDAIVNGSIVMNLTFRYKYDNQNRPIEKTIPGQTHNDFITIAAIY